MSDVGDDYKLLRERSQQKRAHNRNDSADILSQKGVQYSVSNNGAHLIVKHDGVTVDFWPGTGKYIVRTGSRAQLRGRGVFSLLDVLGVSH